jgi:hypothetical protein
LQALNIITCFPLQTTSASTWTCHLEDGGTTFLLKL